MKIWNDETDYTINSSILVSAPNDFVVLHEDYEVIKLCKGR